MMVIIKSYSSIPVIKTFKKYITGSKYLVLSVFWNIFLWCHFNFPVKDLLTTRFTS